MRALALDKAGRWSEAERDLKAGLALNPDEAEILNYLGYTWISPRRTPGRGPGHGASKAVDAEPNSGAVVDSLGWAYYSLGQISAKPSPSSNGPRNWSPTDPEINTHLGDAYWRVEP